MATSRRAQRCHARALANASVALPHALGVGFLLTACTAVLDVDDYVFVDAGGAQQMIPVLPLEPVMDAGKQAPSRPPLPKPVVDPGAVADAGPDLPDATVPSIEPSPVQPLARAVVVDAPEPLVQLAGSPLGGQPRSASCPGGVIHGLIFQYYTSAALQADRLSYVWPVCNRLVASTPVLTDGEAYEAQWAASSPDDPVFAPLRANETIASLICPVGQHLVGIEGTYDEPVDPSIGFRSLAIRCAALGTDAERTDVVLGPLVTFAANGIAPLAGAFPFSQQCPEGRAGNQLELRFGEWLDAVGLRCSVVRWPFTAGHACATGQDCQSGSCGADGLCAP